MNTAARSETADAARGLDAGHGATASMRVYEDLRNRIISFEFPPGMTLSRPDLARRYDVSQTPIREAMLRLEQDDLLRIYRQSRTVVSHIDVTQLTETQFLRMALETEVVWRLARTRPPHAIKRLNTLLRMQAILVDDLEHISAFDDLDRGFHRTMFEGVGMGGLERMLVARSGHLQRIRRLELPMEGQMRTILQWHQRILKAIEAGDDEAARTALRTHISGSFSRVGRLRERFPHYFAGHG